MRSLPLVLLLTCATASASLTDVVQDDAGSGGDAGDGAEAATPLANPATPGSADGTYDGMVVPPDDPEDWYAFLVPFGTVRVDLDAEIEAPSCAQAAPAFVLVQLVDSGGGVADEATIGSCAEPHALLSAVAPAVGRWLVRLAAQQEPPPSDHLPVAVPPLPTLYEIYLWCDPICSTPP